MEKSSANECDLLPMKQQEVASEGTSEAQEEVASEGTSEAQEEVAQISTDGGQAQEWDEEFASTSPSTSPFSQADITVVARYGEMPALDEVTASSKSECQGDLFTDKQSRSELQKSKCRGDLFTDKQSRLELQKSECHGDLFTDKQSRSELQKSERQGDLFTDKQSRSELQKSECQGDLFTDKQSRSELQKSECQGDLFTDKQSGSEHQKDAEKVEMEKDQTHPDACKALKQQIQNAYVSLRHRWDCKDEPREMASLRRNMKCIKHDKRSAVEDIRSQFWVTGSQRAVTDAFRMHADMLMVDNQSQLREIQSLKREVEHLNEDKIAQLANIKDLRRCLYTVSQGKANLEYTIEKMRCHISHMEAKADLDKRTAAEYCQRTMEEVFSRTLNKLKSQSVVPKGSHQDLLILSTQYNVMLMTEKEKLAARCRDLQTEKERYQRGYEKLRKLLPSAQQDFDL